MTEPTPTDACPGENTLVQFAGGTASSSTRAATRKRRPGCCAKPR